MTNQQSRQGTDQVFKTETRIVRIYRREHQLPIIQSDRFQQQQKDIRQRCQLIKEGKPAFLGLIRKPLTIDESIETLDSLIADYESIIRLIKDQKVSYTQFFSDLVDEIKDITTEKFKKIANLERSRACLERQAAQDCNLQLIYQNQRDQLLKAAQLVGCASLLMLKKLALIQNALNNLADDQEVQQQVLDEMLGNLNVYTETHRLQKEILGIQREAADMANIAIDFEEYIGKYLGSLQGLINQVVKLDQKLSVALEEIKGLSTIILGESEVYSSSSYEEPSKQIMNWLTQSALKQGRLTNALKDAEKQALSAVEMDFQLLLENTESDSVTETLAKIQVHLESVFTTCIGQTSPEEFPTSVNPLIHTLVNEGAVGRNLSYANLKNADLKDTDLRFANLRFANLRFANLRFANLSNADLSNADLSNADLKGANLSGADLKGADLKGADLSNANLHRTSLSNANLKGANLKGADLRGTIIFIH